MGEGGIWGRGSSRRDWVKREGKGGWRDARERRIEEGGRGRNIGKTG